MDEQREIEQKFNSSIQNTIMRAQVKRGLSVIPLKDEKETPKFIPMPTPEASTSELSPQNTQLSFVIKPKQLNSGKLLATLNIKINDHTTECIKVLENQDPTIEIQNFCLRNELDQNNYQIILQEVEN